MMTEDVRSAAELLTKLAASHPSDESLIERVSEQFGRLGPREIARAALYASTDPAGRPDLVLRLHRLGMNRIRRI
jgi:hypothetical protein